MLAIIFFVPPIADLISCREIMKDFSPPAFVARVERILARAPSRPLEKPDKAALGLPKTVSGIVLPSLVGLLIGVVGGDLLIKRNVAEFDQQRSALRLSVQSAESDVRSAIGLVDELVGARHTAALRMNQLIAAGNVSGAVAYNEEYTDTVSEWNDKWVGLALSIQRVAQCDAAEAPNTPLSNDLIAARTSTTALRQSGNVEHKAPISDNYCPDAALFSSRQATDAQIFAGDTASPFGSVFEVFRFMHAHFKRSVSPETLLCVRSAEALFQADFTRCGDGDSWMPSYWSTASCVAEIIRNDSPNRLCQSSAFGSSAAIGPARFQTIGFWWAQAKDALLAYRIPYMKKVCKESLAFWTERFGPSCEDPEAILSST
jgi:hypothetical protein